jgi:putative ABC transport system ATP-binding protein
MPQDRCSPADLQMTLTGATRTAMLLSLSNIAKSYQTAEGPIEILRGIELDLAAAESVALTGESGSGKSTLLHLAGGLDKPDGGTIVMNGRDIGALDDGGRARYRRSEVGLVFQQFNLIPSLDVAANISFHAKLAGRFDADWERELIEHLGLDRLLTRYPEQLSGGQQQRVAIGRTLAARPPLVLADEPTGNLDEATGDAVLDLMLSLSRTAGSALLLVTHSMRLADKLNRKVFLRGGKIVL